MNSSGTAASMPDQKNHPFHVAKRAWVPPTIMPLGADKTETGGGNTTEVGLVGMCAMGATMSSAANTNCS